MKIPNIRQSGVSGAEQISLGAIASEGRAKMGQSQALVKVVSAYQDKIIKAETSEEYNRTTNNLSRDSAQLWSDIQDQDRVDENGAATYGAMTGQFNDGFKKLQEKHLGTLKYSSNRGDFGSAANNMFTSYTSTINTEVGRRRVSHLQGQLAENMISYENSATGLADARSALDDAMVSGVVDSSYGAKAWDSFQRTYQTNSLKSQFQSEREMGLNEKGESRGQVFLDNITFPKAMDNDKQDIFSESQQQTIINSMQADLNRDEANKVRAENKVKQEAAAQEIKVWKTAVEGEKMLQSGETMTEERLKQIRDNADLLTDETHIKRMRLANDVYNNVQAMMSMTQEDRQIALGKTFDINTEYDRWVVQDSTKKAYVAIENLVASDPHQAWITYGGGTPMPPVTKENLAESLVQFQDNQAQVEAWLGAKSAPMSDAQAAAIIRMGPAAADDILTAYPREGAEKVFELLYKKGASEMAVVGALALQKGAENVYMSYMLGAEVLKKDSTYKVTAAKQSALGETTGAIFHAYTNGLFKSDTGFNKGLKDATEKVYAYLASESGIMQGELDGDLYREAMSMVVGDVVDYSGEPILLPRGWDMQKLDDAITSMTMEDVVRMGGFQNAPTAVIGKNTPTSPAGSAANIMQQASQTSKPATNSTFVSPERMLIKFKNGEISLRQGSDFGQYMVYAGNRPIMNAQGSPFILNVTGK